MVEHIIVRNFMDMHMIDFIPYMVPDKAIPDISMSNENTFIVAQCIIRLQQSKALGQTKAELESLSGAALSLIAEAMYAYGLSEGYHIAELAISKGFIHGYYPILRYELSNSEYDLARITARVIDTFDYPNGTRLLYEHFIKLKEYDIALKYIVTEEALLMLLGVFIMEDSQILPEVAMPLLKGVISLDEFYAASIEDLFDIIVTEDVFDDYYYSNLEHSIRANNRDKIYQCYIECINQRLYYAYKVMIRGAESDNERIHFICYSIIHGYTSVCDDLKKIYPNPSNKILLALRETIRPYLGCVIHVANLLNDYVNGRQILPLLLSGSDINVEAIWPYTSGVIELDTCPVCFDNKLLVKSKCNHAVCFKCITTLIEGNSSCPLCRAPFV